MQHPALLLASWHHLPIAELSLLLTIFITFTVAISRRLHLGRKRKLGRKFREANGLFAQALSVTQQQFDELLRDAQGFVLQDPPFVGKSKVEHQNGRVIWAQWIAQRFLVHETRRRAEELNYLHAHRPWWNFSLKSLRAGVDLLTVSQIAVSDSALPDPYKSQLGALIAPTNVASDQLPQIVLRDSSRVAASFRVFVDAFRSAANAIASVTQSIAGRSAPVNDGLVALQSRLVELGVPLSPYQPALTTLNECNDSFSVLLKTDPLADYSKLSADLTRRITVLRNRLLKAMEHKSSLENVRGKCLGLAQQIDNKRASQPVSALPEVRFETAFLLDEPDFDLPVLLADCRRQMVDLELLLLNGRLIKFGRHLLKVLEALTGLERTLTQVETDKEAIDSQMAQIDTQSTEIDRQSDRPDRLGICELYRRQRWSAARKAVELLNSRHTDRITVRGQVGDLGGIVVTLQSTIEAQRDVLSQSIEGLLQTLSVELSTLRQQAALGLTDWPSLSAATGALRLRVAGNGASSLEELVHGELAAHEQTVATLTSVVEQFTFVREKVSDRWGDTQVLSQLAEIDPNVSVLMLDAQASKADWRALGQRGQDLLTQLQSVRQSIDTELARYQKIEAQFSYTEGLIEWLKDTNTFTRNVCGIAFGAALFCQTHQFAEPLMQGRAVLVQRNYDAAAAAAELIKSCVTHEYLECCWLVLQTMAHSGEPCALKYASQLGYVDGRFEQWAASLIESGKALFKLPSSPASGHDAKQFLPKGQGLPVDAPSQSDYLRAA